MRGAILTVGTELLRPGRPDGNAAWISERLERAGIEVRARATAPDDPEAIAALLSVLRSQAEVVIVTGGLGPTEDDRTREGLALSFDAPIERDVPAEQALEARFRARGRSFTREQARQADRIRDSESLANELGAACGILVERDGRIVVALPGVPAEMKAIYFAAVEPRLAARPAGGVRRSTLKVAGRTESGVDRAVCDLYGAPGVDVTILAAPTGIELHLRAAGADEQVALARLRAVEHEMVRRLGDDLFGRDDDTLAIVVGRMLSERGFTLATAESCTGGLLGGAVTDVAGSSAWFRGGVVVYGDDLKTSLAGVSAETLAGTGAVSEQTATELARGVRERCGADMGVGVTGIAGPGGGTPAKPVGLIHLAVADARGVRTSVLDLPGGRALVRARAVAGALDLVRRRLLQPE